MAMRIFIDSVAWLALVNKSDNLHRPAIEINRDLLLRGARYVTTDYVLAELANGLARPPYREAAIRFLDALFSSKQLAIVYVTRDRFARAWKLYKARRDKEWGLTDCISFIVMREENIRKAFTSDRHFVQAGYICLLL